MSQAERTGRILLAAAVLLLFLIVVGSMITGELLTLPLAVVAVIAAAGVVLMTRR